MSLVPGDLYVLKSTGERVIVLDTIPVDLEPRHDLVVVRRPVVTSNGTITHEENKFTQGEIISPQEHADAQLAEAIIKAKITMSLDAAVAKLQADSELNQSISQLAAQSEPVKKPN